MKCYLAFGRAGVGWHGYYGPYDRREDAEADLERRRCRGVLYEIVECESNTSMNDWMTSSDV